MAAGCGRPRRKRAATSPRTGGGEPRKVYVVLAEWHLDTYAAPGEPTRCLLRDAHIIGEAPG